MRVNYRYIYKHTYISGYESSPKINFLSSHRMSCTHMFNFVYNKKSHFSILIWPRFDVNAKPTAGISKTAFRRFVCFYSKNTQSLSKKNNIIHRINDDPQNWPETVALIANNDIYI